LTKAGNLGWTVVRSIPIGGLGRRRTGPTLNRYRTEPHSEEVRDHTI